MNTLQLFVTFVGRIFLNKQKLECVKQIARRNDADGTDGNKYRQQPRIYGFAKLIIERRLSAVTAIIKDRTVPRCAPLAGRPLQPELCRRYLHAQECRQRRQERRQMDYFRQALARSSFRGSSCG